MREHRYVILGGGVAGGYAAKELAERGAKAGETLLVSVDDRLPYERPPLSKKYLAGKKEAGDILIGKDEFYREHGIDVCLNTRIRQIDVERRRLVSERGEEFGYERLLLATGSRVRTLDLPGTNLDGVFYLRWLDDAERIRAIAEHSNRAVVIGGGYIGLEVAATLAQKKLQVHLVITGDKLLPRLFTPEMSAFFEDYYARNGVTIYKESGVTALKGRDRVETVTLKSGENVRAEFAVAGVGVEPALELFEGSGFKLDRGLVVDEHLRTGVDGVYAAGDITRYPDPVTGKNQRVEHWDNAVQQAKCAAHNMMGEEERFDHVPYFFSDMFNLSWEFWGDVEGADQTVYRGEISSGRFSAWWLRNSQLVAAFVMDRPDDERNAAEK